MYIHKHLTWRPLIFDGCCCAGGASEGYRRAGYIPFGFDIAPQPNYPYTFKRMDVLEALDKYSHQFDAFHISPPCQSFTWASAKSRNLGKVYPSVDFDTLRAMLVATGKPYVIENVIGARKHLRNPLMLCGTMFGLGVIRHRLFETNPPLYFAPAPCAHIGSVPNGDYVTVAGHGGDGRAALHLWKSAMDIGWMTKEEIVESIPPAYTQWIGGKLMPFVLGQVSIQEAA